MMKSLKKRNLNSVYPILLIFVVFALYGQSLSFDFTYDDAYQIENNYLVVNQSSLLDGIARIFTSPTYPGDQYRPVVLSTYFLQFKLHGLHPVFFHLLNVLLHVACGLLVYVLGMRMLPTMGVAFFGALLFLVHPVHVESVASIVGRTELLAAFFALVSIWIALVRPTQSALLLISFVCAACSKESAFTLVGIVPMLVCIFAPEENKWERARYMFCMLMLASVLLFTLRVLVLSEKYVIEAPHDMYFSENPLLNVPFRWRIFPAIQLFGNYLFLFFWPFSLQLDYSHTFHAYWANIFNIQGVFYTLLSLLYVVLLILARKQKETGLLLWFGFGFGVTINLLLPIGTLMAERLLYFPSAAMALYVTACLFRYAGRGRATAVLLILIVLFFVRSFIRVPVWKHNASVFKQAVIDNPESARTHLMYGMYLHNIAKDYVRAKQVFEKGVLLDPQLTENARYLLDLALSKKRWGEAEHWCKQILKYAPHDENVRYKYQRLRKARGLESEL